MPFLSVIVLVGQSCLTLATPWTVARQAPLSMGFSRQEYWSGQPFPSPGDLPNPGKPRVSCHNAKKTSRVLLQRVLKPESASMAL